MNQVRAKGTPKYFKNAPSMNERGGRFPKENHHEQRYHKPSHLSERDREWELKIIDGIEYLFHPPYAGIASIFFIFSAPFFEDSLGSKSSRP